MMRKTKGVVVLNASFEPLGIVPLRRAMVFLMRERAVIVDAVPGATVRSAAAEFPLPRVVQLREMVRVPYGYAQQPWTRLGVLQRDNYVCAFCGKHGRTIDHVLPVSKGGKNTWANTVTACAKCNNAKGARTPDEARMPLRFQPRVVSRRDTLVVAIAASGANLVALGLA